MKVCNWRRYCAVLLNSLLVLSITFQSCHSKKDDQSPIKENESATNVSNQLKDSIKKKRELPVIDYDTDLWTEIVGDDNIQLDIRYATPNNFMEQKIYDCPRCFLAKQVADSIYRVSKSAKELGLGLILFDCYRPLPYQQKLWDMKPDARYVTPPDRGSMHNRACAVDISLFDKNTGEELKMGSPYDSFVPESHTTYTAFPDTILNNRKQLNQLMKKHGFEGIRTEWWHFSFNSNVQELQSWMWSCVDG